MAEALTVYGDSRSGNCYKVQLACAELGIDYDWREVDIMAGDTRQDDFLAMNPNGKIPLLAIGDDCYLPESNAILCWLADGHALAGGDRLARARVLSWLFFEQYSHEPFIGTARFIVKYLGNPPDKQDALESKRPGGYRGLDIMEQQLGREDYMAGGEFTLADIALFAYTHVAGEGGFALDRYPSINAWMDRVRARPAFVPMQAPAH